MTDDHPFRAAGAADRAHIRSLDGLRAVAVGLVILFHFGVPHMSPGFVGVDVFFVLSGYLITAGLLRDTERFGQPRFAAFWQRRFKRLLPAVTLLLFVFLTWVALGAAAYKRSVFSWDAWWTVIYLGNWHFMQANSYFSSDGVPSPLLHMWSLAVEEQFYLFWPLLLGLVAWVFRRRAMQTRTVAIAGLAVMIAVVSIVLLAALYAREAPDRAYMGTDTKAFEPVLGALLAASLNLPAFTRFVAARAGWLLLGGIAAFVACFPLIDGPSSFYFYGGALAMSLGVTAVIAALVAAPREGLVATVLAWGPLAYLGRISYGLYLWHWPWALWLGIGHGGRFSLARAAAAAAAVLACSVASYHLVEHPVRSGSVSRWFTPGRSLAGVALVMGLVTGWTMILRGDLDGLSSKPHGTTDPRAFVMVGDSVPLRLMPALDQVASGLGLTITSASAGGCSPLAIEQQEYLKPDRVGTGDCRSLAETQRKAIAQDNPRAILWWSRYEVNQRWVGGRLLGPERDEFWEAQRQDLAIAVNRLTAGGATLVFVETERPGVGMLTRCSREECHPLLALMTWHDEYRQRWNAMLAETVAADPRTRLVRMDDVFCSSKTMQAGTSLCDDRKRFGPMRPDGSHVEVTHYGIQVADALVARSREALSH